MGETPSVQFRYTTETQRPMATIRKTPSGTWKALIRKKGWPTNAETFRTKRDAEDWARRAGCPLRDREGRAIGL